MLTAAGAGDVTETDEDSPGLMPYMPVEYQYVPCTVSSNISSPNLYLYCHFRWTYYIECNIAASQFMAWTEGELRPVQVGKTRKINNKRAYKQQYTEYLIPAPYDRIVSQLILEAMHGEAHDTHESHRRLSYAREVLDAFGQELEQLKGRSKEGMVTFRSAILTPLLQRQRRGVDDAYTPSVCAAIRRHASNTLQVEHAKGSLTIRAATNFYLKDDPTNPSHIPSYRRNLLYLPVARWHLGRVLGQPGDQGPEAALAYYKSILEHHDTIMESLHTEAYAGYNADGVPFLTRAEVTAILLEGIEAFFKAELDEQVLHTVLPRACCLPLNFSLKWWTRFGSRSPPSSTKTI